MQNNRENQSNINENQCPSFFKSSCTGIGCSETSETAENNEFENTYEDRPKKKNRTRREDREVKEALLAVYQTASTIVKETETFHFMLFQPVAVQKR